MFVNGVVQKQNRCEDHDRAVPAPVQRGETSFESRATDPGRVQTATECNNQPRSGHFLSSQWTEECQQVIGGSPHGMPTIGAIPGYPRCYAVMGYGGNGITFSMLATKLISAAVFGKTTPAAKLFAFK